MMSSASAQSTTTASPSVQVPALSITAPSPPEGSAALGYKPSTAKTTGPWGSKPIEDTPYSINSVSSDQLDNRITSSTDQIFAHNPLTQLNLNQSRGYGSVIYIRGLRLDSGFNELDGMRVMGDLIMPIEDKDRVEVFSGLSGFLYGPGEAGGLVNYVTKRPEAKPFTEITGGDYGGGQGFGHLDLNGVAGREGKLGYRFNLAGSDGDTAIQYNNVHKWLASMALDLHVTDDLLLQLDYSHQHYVERGTLADWGSFGGAFPHFSADLLDPSKNYSQQWTYNKNEMDVVGAGLTYAIRPDLHFRTAYHYVDIQDENLYTGNNVAFAKGVYTYNLTALHVAPRDNINNTGYAFLDYDFDALSTHNKVTIGYYTDSYELDLHQDATQFLSLGTFAVGPNPIYVSAPHFTNGSLPVYTSQTTVNGNWIIGDELKINDQWSVLFGLNRSEIDTTNYATTGATASHYDKVAVTPSASVLFKPLPWLTTYVTYIESLQNSGTASPTFNGLPVANANQGLAPTTSTQYEVGVKADVGRMLLTAALFQIDKANTYYAQAADGASYSFTNDGEQTNKGLEFTATGKVTPDLTVVGGIDFLDAKITKTNTVYLQGATPYGAARSMAKLYAEYAVRPVPGLTMTGGVDYVGKQLANAFAAPNPAAREYLSSYTIGNVGARYERQIYGTDTIWRFDVENVSDEHYWQQAEIIGMPRTFSFSATARF